MINAAIILGLGYLIIFLLIIKCNFKELNYWIKQQRNGIIWKREQTYLAGELTLGEFHLEFFMTARDVWLTFLVFYDLYVTCVNQCDQ